MSRLPFFERLARWLIAWRWPLLAVALMLAALAYGPARGMRFDRSIENMFAADDPLLAPYRQLKRTFGGNEIVMAAYVDPQLLTPDGIARLAALTKRLAAVPGVAHVVSLSNTPLEETIVEDKPISRDMIDVFEGYTVGADRQSAAVVCMLRSEADSPVSREATVAQMRAQVEAAPWQGVIAGEPVMIVEGFRSLEVDGRWLGWISTVLLILTIWYCFRSFRWVIVPLAVVNVTLYWTEASLVVAGFRLSMVSSMLWAVVTVVGIASVVHLIVGIREERARGLPPREALAAAIAGLAVPILWALATDAAGFASLLAASVGPVQDFGLMMAVGSVLAVPAVGFLVPGLALAGRIDADPRRAWGEHRLDGGLERLVEVVLRRKKAIVAATLLVAAVAGAGSVFLDVETDFTRNFRANSPVVRSYELVETRLGGAGVWDVYLPAPERLDEEFLGRVRRLQQRLRTEVVVSQDSAGGQPDSPGLTKVISLVDALDALQKTFRRSGLLGILSRVVSPTNRVNVLDRQMPGIVPALLGKDPENGQQYYRIMLRARERQTAAQKRRLIDDVARISREEFPDAQVTGFFVLLANLIQSLVRDQWICFLLATTAIGLMMWAAFRSLKLAVVAMLPNLLPLFVVMGTMGWLSATVWPELKINMGAAMIAAVSMGLAVDSSTHYIIVFQRLRRGGLSLRDCFHAAHQSAGRAMTFSTLALMVGFSALCLSEFVPTIYFGALMCLSMLGGLLGNLVLLPLLLSLVERDKVTASAPVAEVAEAR